MIIFDFQSPSSTNTPHHKQDNDKGDFFMVDMAINNKTQKEREKEKEYNKLKTNKGDTTKRVVEK